MSRFHAYNDGSFAMSDNQARRSKKIFLSYASADIGWIANFTQKDIFLDILGNNVSLENYKNSANFGSIKQWIEENIESAAAVIVFLSKNYRDSRYSVVEFHKSLREHARRRLIFVPVIMDAEAVSWWQEVREKNELEDLAAQDDSYSFVNFVGPDGEPVTISNGEVFNDRATSRIAKLAQLIREKLKQQVSDKRNRGQSPQDNADRPWPDTPRPAREPKPVVLLGHPAAGMPQVVRSGHDELKGLLEQADVSLTSLPDEWLAERTSHRDKVAGLLARTPVFVQPVGRGEGGELAGNPETVRNRLKELVGTEPTDLRVDKCPLYLWLPADLDDARFEAATVVSPTILSHESPSALAKRLHRETSVRPPVPVIMLEFANNAGLRSQLADEFNKVVEQEVAPPLETWDFNGDFRSDMLETQIKNFEGDRAILAVHDMNVGPALDMDEARSRLELKLRGYMERVQRAQKVGRRNDLKFFWSTLVLRNGKYLPFIKYPAREFDDWHLLSFVKVDGQAKPDPHQALIFCAYLRDWAQPTAAWI